VPRITDFCSCIYVLGYKLSRVRFCDSDFGITAVDVITIGIICAAFCFHIIIIIIFRVVRVKNEEIEGTVSTDTFMVVRGSLTALLFMTELPTIKMFVSRPLWLLLTS